MSERIVLWERVGEHLKARISGVDCMVIKLSKGAYQIQVGIKHRHAILSFIKRFATQHRAKMVAHAVAIRFAAACLDLSTVDEQGE